MNIQFIVAFDFIDRGRDDPAEEKNAHNDEPDGIKVKIPKHIQFVSEFPGGPGP